MNNNNIKNTNDYLKEYITLAKTSNEELLKKYNTSLDGLSPSKAHKILESEGPNITIKDTKKNIFSFILASFKDEFILILLFLGLINFLLKDTIGSIIILLIALISASIRFLEDYSIYKFNQKLKNKITTKVTVIRNKIPTEINMTEIVPGDIVKLNAGAIIPADIKILESKDLFLNQANYTGESILVEKVTSLENQDTDLFNISNIALMSSNVVSGLGTGLVLKTGFNTYLGSVGTKIKFTKNNTNFQQGIKSISKLLVKYMVIVCLFVIIVDGLLKHNFSEALLFALSVAVGITPSMLPMIVNSNLSKGSRRLAKKNVLIKDISSIQNLGSIDILCTDKTGTLTENKIVLEKYLNADGQDDKTVLEYAYLNSTYSTGIKNLVDKAIIAYGKKNNLTSINEYEKIDEIPFDYTRKKQSIAFQNKSKYLMITKGALEEILTNCQEVQIGKKVAPLSEDLVINITKKAEELASLGMQVIALAIKNTYPGKEKFNPTYEKNMIFAGLIAFLDEPKKGVKTTLNNLSKINVKVKILTGDNPYATKNICSLAGLNSTEILLGSDIDKMTDEELLKKLDTTDVFARMNPLEKERVVNLYRQSGKVVGYMGDGVNDAPALSSADVGISVNTAANIAKETSDIILLKSGLNVIYDGILEGRKVYGNIIKYMKMALSGDLGDVISIMLASIFLPFLPLIPIQMLIQDFIYDFSQLGIPDDDVDAEYLTKPRKWNVKSISRFMIIMGLTSSVIDVLAFLIFLFIFKYNTLDKASFFQTAWFVTCLVTELTIIYNIRTSKIPFIQSNASKKLNILIIFSLLLTIITPIILSPFKTFNFVILPFYFYFLLFALTGLYFLLVLLVKKIYIKRYGEWL